MACTTKTYKRTSARSRRRRRRVIEAGTLASPRPDKFAPRVLFLCRAGCEKEQSSHAAPFLFFFYTFFSLEWTKKRSCHLLAALIVPRLLTRMQGGARAAILVLRRRSSCDSAVHETDGDTLADVTRRTNFSVACSGALNVETRAPTTRSAGTTARFTRHKSNVGDEKGGFNDGELPKMPSSVDFTKRPRNGEAPFREMSFR